MKINKPLLRSLAATFVAFGTCAYAYAQDVYTLRLKNALGINRVDELVEVSMPDGAGTDFLLLKDANGVDVPMEVTANGTILFRATVPQGGTAEYTLRQGEGLHPEKMTYAAVKAPGSRDDIAWENDLAAYRMYSSTLLKSEPNTGNGVDLWQKKMSKPIIDNMYALSNYHSESAYGVDAYTVNGKRLGAGGISHVVDGKIVIHNPYDRCEIIENGALRSSFRLYFDNVDVDGDTYTKIVTVETTAGSMLNKATVRYEGRNKPIKLGVALYLHTDISGDFRTVTYTDVPGLIGLAEQPSEGTVTSPNPRFYLGAYMPGVETETEVLNDHLTVTTIYTPGTDLTYYFGGGWNVFPADTYATDDDWFDALNQFHKKVDSPLVETSATSIPNREDVLNLLHNVNRHWIDTHPNHESHFWDKAVYHTGNMAAFAATGEEDYRLYSEAWSIHNNWTGATGTDPSRWKYSYGEGGDYVLFGDNQICFQIYCDLYSLDPEDYKIARAIEVMEYQMSTDNVDYWWWVDGLYMVMPVMTKLYNITGNQLYLDKMYEYWAYATELMYDEEEHLYYRDGGYVYPGWSIKVGDDPTPKKDFWARGDGWIFAAFARVLEELPVDDIHRDEYIAIYKEMAAALKAAQQPEGHWTRSILEPNYATGYETSGTALFTYGYLWGVNNGIFSDKEYGDVIEKAWNYLTTIAVQDNYDVGYVQPIGSKAEPGVIITAGQTANFGTGAFLLAASEMTKYAAGDADISALRISSVKLVGNNTITCVFNQAPDAQQAVVKENYTLNGSTIWGEPSYDGDRTVTFAFDTPLEYGRYLFEVSNVTSAEGGPLAENQSRNIVCTVPLTACLPGITVTASGYQSGNPPQNTIDNKYATRWSQAGKNQWILYDLGTVQTVNAVDIAFYAGSQRKSFFSIEISEDGTDYRMMRDGLESSGLTDELERYAFDEPVEARYVRLVCNGNSQGGDNWNSITETRIVYDMTNSDIGVIEGMPAEVYADILMPQTTSNGFPIIWESTDPDHLNALGYVHNPEDTPVDVTMIAHIGKENQSMDVKVMPRSLENTLMVNYRFSANDVYSKGEATMVKDYSGKGRDAQIMGSAVVNGVLDLTANTSTGFATNGYALAPEGILDSLRSYTFMFTIYPMSLNKQPRAYDFGSASSNSVFFRLNSAAAGLKYNGGTTVLISTSMPFEISKQQKVAVTFDAYTKTTKVYLDGKEIASSTSIANEPYELALIGADKRNYIGRTQWWDTSAKNDNSDFQGTIDDFRLYKMALTPDEMAKVQEFDSGIADVVSSVVLIDRTFVNRGESINVGCQPGDLILIYNANGMLAQSRHATAETENIRVDMPSGLYIVTINGSSAKFVVK